MATTYTIGARTAAPAAPGAGRLGHAGRRVVQAVPAWVPRRLMLRARVGGAAPVPGRGSLRWATLARAAGASPRARAGAVRYATPARAAGAVSAVGEGVISYRAPLRGPEVGSVLTAAGALHLGGVGARLLSVRAVSEAGPLGLCAARALLAVGTSGAVPVTVTRAGDEVLALPLVWRGIAWPAGGYIGGLLAALAVLRGEPVTVADGLAVVAGRVVVDAAGQGMAAADEGAAYELLQADYADLLAVAGGMTVPESAGRDTWLDWLRMRNAAEISVREKQARGAAVDCQAALRADLHWLEVRA